MRRIGVLGGTFNPIHNGHLALAKAALKEFALDQVLFIPTGTPPHKPKKEIIDKEYRYRLVKLAIAKIKYFSVSRMEMDRPGTSYAVDTFRQMRNKYGKKVKLFYIMGLDSINEILEWKKPLELFKLCEVIVATRPGTRLNTFHKLLKSSLKTVVDKIYLMELKADVSSSAIRQKLRLGKKIAHFVPKTINSFILKNSLYRSKA
jgi:nicotinate-nucleotide adenylyltransferase